MQPVFQQLCHYLLPVFWKLCHLVQAVFQPQFRNLFQKIYLHNYLVFQEEEDDIESEEEEEEVEEGAKHKPVSPTDWHKAGQLLYPTFPALFEGKYELGEKRVLS